MKKILFIIGAIMLPLFAEADAVEIDGIYYNLDTNAIVAEVTLHPNRGYQGDITIPKTVTYEEIVYSVTSIGSYTFSGCTSLASITIPNSVTSIGTGAFQDCSALTSISIPNSVTSIFATTFSFCKSLTSITIPNSVTFIDNGA